MQSVHAARPAALCRSLTWHRGKELTHHAELTAATGLAVFFADQHDEWAVARRYLSEASMAPLTVRETAPAVTAELPPSG